MYSLVLIEDEVTMLEGIKKYIPFQDLHIQLVGCATNGLDGLKQIEVLKPDIVISDINMPVMSGIELLKYVDHSNIKFIFLTAHANFEYAKQAISHGVVEYLLKPVFPGDISNALKKCIDLLEKEAQYKPAALDGPAAENQEEATPIINKMRKYAAENIRDVSLEQLAQYLGFSVNHLRNLYKNETGVSFKKYITALRMEKAKKLLESNYYKVYEVADMVGYKDIKSFRAAFKEHFGTPPSSLKN